MAERRLLDRFVRLCEIPSPTGAEREVADVVIAELRALGCDVSEDGAAAAAGAGAGNVVARLPADGERWLSLFAHLDTVPHEAPIEVVEADGVFRSRGDTILGADNKAAVAVLLELATRAVERGAPPVGLELVFTVAEEQGLRGAKELDVSSLRAPYGYALDHASAIGDVVIAAPSYNRIVAEFEGTEAHAGIRPDVGHSAIEAAAAAIAAMRLGRLDEETTANVGVIGGGTATNVVAGRCRIEAEARSLDEGKVMAATGAIVDACTWGASEGRCDVDVDVVEMFRGYRVSPGSAPVRTARAALQRAGVAPREVATGGGSDANALQAQGYACVLLANGTEANHTSAENVAAASLVRMVEVCEALADEVAREPLPC